MNQPRQASEPEPTDPASRREAQEDEQRESARRREVADAGKRFRRERHDSTRSHERGTRQSNARLERERARDDASLTEEREGADHAQARQRRWSEQVVWAETERRQAAESRIERVLENLTVQSRQVSDLKRRALEELQAITRATRDVLLAADARRSVEVEIRAITTATERLSDVLNEIAPDEPTTAP